MSKKRSCVAQTTIGIEAGENEKKQKRKKAFSDREFALRCAGYQKLYKIILIEKFRDKNITF